MWQIEHCDIFTNRLAHKKHKPPLLICMPLSSAMRQGLCCAKEPGLCFPTLSVHFQKMPVQYILHGITCLTGISKEHNVTTEVRIMRYAHTLSSVFLFFLLAITVVSWPNRNGRAPMALVTH